MAKKNVNVKFNNRAFRNDVLRAFNKVKRNRQMLDEVGDFLVKRLKSSAKKGQPFNERRSFPPLERSTIRNRRNLSKHNRTSDVYRSDRSNVSFSGQLLDSLDFFIKSGDVIDVRFTKRRTPYRSGTGRFQKQNDVNARNQDLANQLAEGIRSKSGLKKYVVFSGITVQRDVKINNRINSIVRKFLRRAIRAQFVLKG